MSRRAARPGLAAAAAAVGLVAAGCGASVWPGGSGADGVAVAVERASMQFTVPAAGYLEAMKASPIAVPRVPTGALKVKQLVPEGSIVAPGDVVVVFDDTQLNIELDNHKATFRSADRRIERTNVQSTIESGSIEVMKEVAELERDYSQNYQITDTEIFSRLEILEEQVRRREAGETILFADASLLLRGQYYDIEERILNVEKGEVQGKIGRVETSLGSLILKAPIGGLVVYKKNWRGATVGVGDSLWPGNVILAIVDPASVALTAYVLEKDAAGVQKGAEAQVVVDARPEHAFKGSVLSIAEVSRPIERNSPVKYSEVKVAIADGDPALLKPGMKAEAHVAIGRVDDGVVVPRTALRGDAQQPFVLVENGGEPERRTVKLGPGDHVLVSVVEGLSGGERVLLGGEDQAEAPERREAGPPSPAPGPLAAGG